MSVQAGIWNLDGEPVDREFLTGISQNLMEYGPDGETIFIDGPVGMLYRPLHTTGESRIERQPYILANGWIITWDGRLDNRDELIPDLCRSLTGDHTDVAIVAAAFDQWGTDCFARLIGDWALSFWNSRDRELILARDYMGIRHLFYYPKPRTIVWCSHLAPLALCGDHFTLCDEYVAGYLASRPEAHLTPYQEIQAVPPGKFVRLHGGRVLVDAYWMFNTKRRTRYKTDAEYEQHYRCLFRQAVRRRLRADSPILADLSGGFDSSSIVCMADDISANEGGAVPRVDTFSFYDSNEPDDDDLPHVMAVEEQRHQTGFHANLRGSGRSFSFEYPTFVAHPGFGTRVEVTSALADLLKQRNYRIQLSGRGGDDVNGQCLDPRVHMAGLLLQGRLVELAKQLTQWSLLIRKRPWIHLFFQVLLQIMPISVRARFTKHWKLEPWISRALARQYNMSEHQMGVVRGSRYARPSYREAIQTIVTLSRRMSCAPPSVIDTRYPHLDQQLVEFLTTIPLDQLLRPSERRSLMRRALADLLPASILTRRTKATSVRCFSVVLAEYWDKVETAFSSPLISRLGYVETVQINKALIDMKNGNLSVQVLSLLNALSLEFWLRDAEARGVFLLSAALPRVSNTGLLEPRAQFSSREPSRRTRRLHNL